MLKFKLEALEHPAPDSVNVNDRTSFASTVLWLEDLKIRHYRIEDREPLRNVNNLPAWEPAYAKYKQDLEVPKFATPLEELTWLLSYAVRLEYLDNADSFKSINSEEVSKKSGKSNEPSIKAENFFDNMDFNNKDFIAGVRTLASKLGIPHHPNHLELLAASARVVRERLVSKNFQIVEGTPFPFEQGNDVVADDPALDLPVRALRLLQIQRMRQLQTLINEGIVAVQEITANPKTDTKLGKVGF